MFRIDMHIHTMLGGDSSIRPEDVVDQARRVGLHAVCITEHHDHALSRPLDRIAAKEHYPVFRGLEYRAAEGHLLIYGVRAGKGDLLPGLPMQMVIDWVNQKGGAAIPAHPFQDGLVGRAPGERVLSLKGLVALETLNGSVPEDKNRLAHQAACRLGVNGIGGSDAHGIQALGSAWTCFRQPIKSEAELVSALRNGTYFPQSGAPEKAFGFSNAG